MIEDPALDFYLAHRMPESIAAYRRQLAEGPDKYKFANIDGLGHALMANGDYSEAIPYLEIMHDRNRGAHPGALGRPVLLSVCHWMSGDRERALEIIRQLVIDVRTREVYYTDFAGGTSYGVILCYMAATLKAADDVALALKFLRWATRRRYAQSWPGPAAAHLLGKISLDDAMIGATGTSDIETAKAIGEEKVMKRRNLTSLLFAAGTARRVAGDEDGCRRLMGACASLTDTLCEYEWHLACREVSRR